MAGTIPLSMTQQLNLYGEPLSGGQLYIIVAGTVSTPQDAFADTALTIKMPYPMTLDAAGRIPQFFLDNSVNATVKIRLQDKSGVVQLAADQVLIIGPSSGGGGGGSVDPTQLIQTGNMILRHGTDVLSGYVRGNGLTIGSASSGATERPNADCQALFQHLWGADSLLAVSPARGTSAALDWSANKRLALPDYRARLLMGLADMGNSDNMALAGITFSNGNATKLGSTFGNVTHTNTVHEMAIHRHGVALNDPSHSHTGHTTATLLSGSGAVGVFGGSLGLNTGSVTIDGNTTGITISDGAGTPNAVTAIGDSAPFDITNPAILITIYLKL